MENQPWWKESISEELTIISLLVIVVVSLLALGPEGKDIVLPIGGGLVGYLTKTIRDKLKS
jgi:hypothetical protein